MRLLAKFRGPIQQVPPMYSALKRDGKPLYEYARAGITLERAARPVTIHLLEFIAFETPMLTLRVRCSKGTYIRVLGEEIGAALGCGGHLNALRRIAVGALTLADAVTLEQLALHPESERAVTLRPVDALLVNFLPVFLTEELARRFLHGQRLSLGKEAVDAPTDSGRVRVYRASDQRLLGTGQMQEFGVLAPERLVSTAN